MGFRGGYTFEPPVYVGAHYVRHFGREDTGPGYRDAYGLDAYGLEGGYELAVRPITLRPHVGVGRVVLHVDHDLTGGTPAEDETIPSLYVAGGVVAVVELGPVFVGLDSRLVYITDSYTTGDASFNPSNLAAYGFVGARL